MPHINTLDYIPWPAFRELAVQIPAMQQRMEWLIDMSNTMCCDWSSTQEPLQRDEETGLIDVCASAKVRVELTESGVVVMRIEICEIPSRSHRTPKSNGC